MTDIRSILDPLTVPQEVKAAAWDAFQSSRNDAEFRIKFAGIALPREAKASLWDAKAFTPEQTIQPKPATPASGVDVPSLTDEALALPGKAARGALKGAYSTGLGLSKLAGGVPQSTTLNDLAVPFTGGKQAISAPKPGVERTAFDTEQLGEFFLPESLVGKARKGVEALAVGSKFPRVAKALGTAAVEGASAGAVAGAQTGSVDEAQKAALVAGGVTAAAPLVLGAAKQTGVKIEKWLMGATKRDLENGFKVENVFKYDVGGTLPQTWEKTEKKLNDLTGMLQASLKGSPGNVKLANSYLATLKDFSNNPQADEALQRIIKRVEFDLNKRGINLGTGVLNVAEANIVKQSIGDLGAWIHSPGGKVVSDADRITEEVANKFYGHLKGDIETKAVGPVKEINRALGDLMAIRQATLRRLPVVDRQAALGLGDLFAMSSGNLGISFLSALSKSGAVANALVKGSASSAKAVPAISKAAASQAGER